MSGILRGLSKLGLSKLEKADVYETKEPTGLKKSEKEPVVIHKKTESDYLFDKSYVCPVCEERFKTPTIKAGKTRVVSMDEDLKPNYEGIDPLKYDVVMCSKCGYAALTRFFPYITHPQAKLIEQQISRNFTPVAFKRVLSYDDSFLRYQLALGCTIVKHGKTSERAYLCLKMAWLIRNWMLELDKDSDSYSEDIKQMKEDENELLSDALEGFLAARQTEPFPICGMDEKTYDFIIAALAVRFNKFELASTLLGNIISSRTANQRLKDCALSMRDKMKSIKEELANNSSKSETGNISSNGSSNDIAAKKQSTGNYGCDSEQNTSFGSNDLGEENNTSIYDVFEDYQDDFPDF